MPQDLMITASLTSLDHRKILRTLKGPGRDPVPSQDPDLFARLEKQLRFCEEEVLRYARPVVSWRIFPVSGIEPLLEGHDIRHLLEGCREAVLMALTLGTELERRLMAEEVTDMGNAYLLDVCASQAVEEAADTFEDGLRRMLLAKGQYLTNRYSPGYGDFSLSVQGYLLEAVNASRAIGLTLTKSGLMVPRKSITAVMGICGRPKDRILGGCARCPLLTKCSFREHGKRCFVED